MVSSRLHPLRTQRRLQTGLPCYLRGIIASLGHWIPHDRWLLALVSLEGIAVFRLALMVLALDPCCGTRGRPGTETRLGHK